MVTAVIAVLAVGLAFLLRQAGQRIDEAQLALADARNYLKEQKVDEAVKTLRRGIGQLEEIGGDLVATGHLGMEPILHVDEDQDGLIALEQVRVRHQ